MKRCMLILTVGLLTAAAAGEVVVTFNNDAVRTLDRAEVQDGRLMLPADNLSVPITQVRSARFVFTNFSENAVTDLLARGAFREIADRTDRMLESIGDGVLLPGNIDRWLLPRLQALLLTGQLDEAAATADLLEQKNSPAAATVPLYRVLIRIERDEIEAAAAAFDALDSPDALSVPMSELIRGRLAVEAREYETALRHFSNVLVDSGRDPVWAPAAELAEGRVYKRTGYLEAAAHVADTLSVAYPGAWWSRQAGELR